MKIEIAEHGRMSESGSSLLRLIQNQDIPLLDLIIRESLQNSLDATNGIDPSVNVDITVGEFRSNELNKHFEQIENGLNKRFPATKGTYSFMSFRDSNTIGLTGPVRYEDVKNNDFGNLLKLVYEICKPQQNEGAGGSWGLGKTIYFRLGIGLVIYYSRVFQKGRYQSRLAACLVEDETQRNSLIPQTSGVKRGIAWWGRYEGLRTKSTVPLDNEKEIERILSVFGINSYSGTNTGTTVIIPYIDKKALLSEVYAVNDSAEQMPYWAYSVEEYLKVATQRWYAPRLLNDSYPYGAYLDVRINGTKLKVSEMQPLFRLVRDFYILAKDGDKSKTSMVLDLNLDYSVTSIDLRGVLNSTSAGQLVVGKFSKEQLLMNPPHNNKSPYQQISNIDVSMDGGNGPIIMFTRRPGMIVGYDYDGTWTHRMPKAGSDEFIIGLFVANTDNTLKNIKDPRTDNPMSLEEYIRQGEKADHASWTDRNIMGNNPRIVSNIQKNIINKVKKQYTEVQGSGVVRQNIGLGHALANLLLPSEDFGDIPTPPVFPGFSSGSSSGVTRIRSRKSSLRITSYPMFKNDTVAIDFEMDLRNVRCEIALQIITDFKRYEADGWEEELGKSFPVAFSELQVTQLTKLEKGKGNPERCLLLLDDKHIRAESQQITLEYRLSHGNSKNCYVSVIPHGFSGRATGRIVFNVLDPRVRGSIDIKEMSEQ